MHPPATLPGPTLQLLPTGLAVPPLPYLVALVVGAASVGYALYASRPTVTRPVIVSLAPWMVAGAGLHALYQLGAVPAVVAPLTGAPAVYVTTAIVAGAAWTGLTVADTDGIPRWLAAGGTGAAVVIAVLALLTGVGQNTLSLFVPALAVVLSALVAAVGYWLLRQWRPAAVEATGSVGVLVVVGHALDGVSTAAGVDLLGTAERTPIPRTIMEFAASLPTAPYIGQGWLFVLVKLVVALGVLVLFADYVREEPVEGNVVLALIAAVGLGPGAHNVLLFAAAGAA